MTVERTSVERARAGAAFRFGALALLAGVTTPVSDPSLGADVTVQQHERHDIAKHIWSIAVIVMGNGDVDKHGLEMKKLKVHPVLRYVHHTKITIRLRSARDFSKALLLEHMGW